MQGPARIRRVSSPLSFFLFYYLVHNQFLIIFWVDESMNVSVEVRIAFKKGVVDAEGETVAKSLKLLGFPVTNVATVQVYEVAVEAGSEKEALTAMDDACKRLLANPVIQDYDLKVTA